MICDTCIHKNVCNEKEEDRKALKFCADQENIYLNQIKELEKVKEKINKVETMRQGQCGCSYKQPLEVKEEILKIITNEISHLKKL